MWRCYSSESTKLMIRRWPHALCITPLLQQLVDEHCGWLRVLSDTKSRVVYCSASFVPNCFCVACSVWSHGLTLSADGKKKASTEWCGIHKSQEVTNDRAWHNWSFRVIHNLTPAILINLNSLLYFRGLSLYLILWVLGAKISGRKLLLSLIAVTAQSKAWVCDRLLAGICGVESRQGNG
jgi:hypothetical protein